MAYHPIEVDEVAIERFLTYKKENVIYGDNIDAPGGPCEMLPTRYSDDKKKGAWFVKGRTSVWWGQAWWRKRTTPGGPGGRLIYAAVAAWVAFHRKPVPAGGHVHHKCGNPNCSNPHHLMMFETPAEHRAWHKAHPLESQAYDGGFTDADEVGQVTDSCTA